MSYDMNMLERANLVSLLEGYKQITKQFDEIGMFDGLEEDFQAKPIIKACDYYIDKFSKSETEVDASELETMYEGKYDGN